MRRRLLEHIDDRVESVKTAVAQQTRDLEQSQMALLAGQSDNLASPPPYTSRSWTLSVVLRISSCDSLDASSGCASRDFMKEAQSLSVTNRLPSAARHHEVRATPPRAPGTGLGRLIVALKERYGVLVNSPAFVPDLSHVAVPELQDLRATLAEIQASVAQVDWYKKVNEDALRRIQHKTLPEMSLHGPTAEGTVKAWRSEVLITANRIQRIISAALDEEDKPDGRVSLLADQFLQAKGLKIPEAALQAVAADDAVALEACPTGQHVDLGADFMHRLVIRTDRQPHGGAGPETLRQALSRLPESDRCVWPRRVKQSTGPSSLPTPPARRRFSSRSALASRLWYVLCWNRKQPSHTSKATMRVICCSRLSVQGRTMWSSFWLRLLWDYTIETAMGRQPSMFLEVSTLETSQPPRIVQFPILEDYTNDPWRFGTQNPSDEKLVFRLFNASGDDDDDGPVGTAVALLGSLRRGLGPERESLIRDHTVPLVDPRGNLVGTVTFTFLLARTFGSARPPPTAPQRLERPRSTLVGGHRGLGQNDKLRQHLQLGENTLESFLAAVDLGADMIEFDVQVTKDHVPVVYHDFLVTESGQDATDAHHQTRSVHVHQRRSSRQDRAAVGVGITETALGRGESPKAETGGLPPRTAGCRHGGSCRADEHTLDFGPSGFKPNLRREHIHAPFIALKDLLLQMPANVVFDMELSEHHSIFMRLGGMDLFTVKLNKFLDCILDIIYEFGGDRPILFTSFSPELYMALAAKQDTYPILFLNDSCNWPTGDVRTISIQTAVHFSRHLGLDGVVMASEPFVASPKLVKAMQDRGLYCASYGALNDEPDKAKAGGPPLVQVPRVPIQADAGLDDHRQSGRMELPTSPPVSPGWPKPNHVTKARV
ncbi:Glycerophosphoryl diester phosphodiesterase family-domain-containing protein [Schizothecium vesticola]|uniref:Glycerophosphoryl diester phosphodiesterase family-domain-containing protein n=1 Tax=Schizothecium vesticola TaxID=314040 RepID=A0AA40FA95_9PEZI|nr:Glycerophosphoryl diester phosphodiesterase family-domain-containing protein [Schizothecium vesticola]